MDDSAPIPVERFLVSSVAEGTLNAIGAVAISGVIPAVAPGSVDFSSDAMGV